MSLADQIAADISSVFLNTDDFAVLIDYGDGVSSIATGISAIAENVGVEVSTEFGVTRYETRDYLFRVSDLSRKPQRGDKITEGSKIYAVSSPGGQSEWQYDDENQLLYRVHTVFDRDS